MEGKFIDDNMDYEVEEIIDKKDINGILYYKIKWYGFPLSQATWEPLENLKAVEWMVKKFETQSSASKQCHKAVKSAECDNHNNTTSQPKSDTSPKAVIVENKIKQKHNKKGNLYEDYGLVPPNPFVGPSIRKAIRKPHPAPEALLLFDVPEKISGVRKGETGIEAMIQWEKRKDGLVPAPTWHAVKELRKRRNLARMLLAYYESIIKE